MFGSVLPFLVPMCEINHCFVPWCRLWSIAFGSVLPLLCSNVCDHSRLDVTSVIVGSVSSSNV